MALGDAYRSISLYLTLTNITELQSIAREADVQDLYTVKLTRWILKYMTVAVSKWKLLDGEFQG